MMLNLHKNLSAATAALMIGLLGLALMQPAAAQTRNLVTELSSDEVDITTNFNGTSLLLFGAVKEHYSTENAHIVVTVSGPKKPIASRYKQRVSGIWINTSSVKWKNAPSYYHILTSQPMDTIMTNAARDRFGIGYEYLPLRWDTPKGITTEEINTIWKPALDRNMRETGLWATHEGGVSVLRDSLFRASVALPANILPGDYEVRVLQFEDGTLIAEDITAITVEKKGLGEWVYRFAHDYSAFYGLFAILFAIASGWLAAVAFRRK